MAVADVLAGLADQWDRVDAALNPEDRSELRRLIVELQAVDDRDEQGRRRAQSEIAQLLMRSLPKSDPLVVLGDRLATATDVTPRSLVFLLRSRMSEPGQLPASQRILSEPWDTAVDLRDRGVDPDLPDLIRLDHSRHDYAVPSFQFDPEGQPIPVVLAVNEVLDAFHDPWGAAYWWLHRNVWLAARPSDLIETESPETLLAAAVAAVEG
jgi:hypothetical protein